MTGLHIVCRLLAGVSAVFAFSSVVWGDPGHPHDDRMVLAVINQLNEVDLATARVAGNEASSKEVRGLAMEEAREHALIKKQIQEMAQILKMNPKLIGERLGSYAMTVSSLQEKSGKEFDSAYLKHEIVFHTNIINSWKNDLLPTVQNDELAQMLLSSIDQLQGHLDKTKAIANELNIE